MCSIASLGCFREESYVVARLFVRVLVLLMFLLLLHLLWCCYFVLHTFYCVVQAILWGLPMFDGAFVIV